MPRPSCKCSPRRAWPPAAGPGAVSTTAWPVMRPACWPRTSSSSRASGWPRPSGRPARIQAGDVLVLDVRPAAEYAAGHITGAVGIPHDELSARLSELPGGIEIVAYCRGRYCVMAPEAVRILRHHGYAARPLQDGLPEWRRAGLPVTTRAAALPASGAVGWSRHAA